jgi:hypothetical protein
MIARAVAKASFHTCHSMSCVKTQGGATDA